MNIEFYEKEKNEPIEFDDLECGEFFVKAKDALDDNIPIELYKKITITADEQLSNAVLIDSINQTELEFFNHDADVYRVEIKKIVIDVDW